MPLSLDFLRGPGFLQNLLEEMQQQQLASQLQNSLAYQDDFEPRISRDPYSGLSPSPFVTEPPQRRDPFEKPYFGEVVEPPMARTSSPRDAAFAASLGTDLAAPEAYPELGNPEYSRQFEDFAASGSRGEATRDPYGHVRELLSEALGNIGPAEGTPTEASIAAYRQKNKWPRFLSQLGAIFASMGTSPMLGRFLGAQAARYAGEEHQMRQQMEDDAVRQQALRQKLLGSEIGVEADIAKYQAGEEERQAIASRRAAAAEASAAREARIREADLWSRQQRLEEHQFRVDQARMRLEEKYLNAETDEEAKALELEIKKLTKTKKELDIEGKRLDNERKRLGAGGYVPSAADQAALDASETY